MRTTLLRLATALATFGVGVTLATLWLGLNIPGGPRVYERESCRFRERAVPAPLPPVPPAPLAAPVAPLAQAPKAAPCEAGPVPTADGDYSRLFVASGALDDEALSLPAPTYPAAARAAGASGTVTVEVVVDECGEVASARAVSGHPLLRQSAVEAARSARFAPAHREGQRASVSGTLAYDFAIR
jgi:protein TonB